MNGQPAESDAGLTKRPDESQTAFAIRCVQAAAWDEGRKARPQYLGPDNGHDEDCLGWGDCLCGTYVNPYRVLPPVTTQCSEESR